MPPRPQQVRLAYSHRGLNGHHAAEHVVSGSKHVLETVVLRLAARTNLLWNVSRVSNIDANACWIEPSMFVFSRENQPLIVSRIVTINSFQAHECLVFSAGEIGYIDTYRNDSTQARSIVYIDDAVDQGTVIRTKDNCLTIYCTADGVQLSENQCSTSTVRTTTPKSNSSTCEVQQSGKAQLKINNGQCISRKQFARERCGGSCASNSDDQCKCCSVGATHSESVVFDCFVNGSTTVTEEKTIEIRRISSCNCNVCRDGCSVRRFDSAPLRVNNNQCVSRELVPRERCDGQCESDSISQCTCCSIAQTYIQPMLFDCAAVNTTNPIEQKTLQIRRIQSCNCNTCVGGLRTNG